MMTEPVFLSLDEILYIHTEEIKISGGEPNIRDLEGVKACVDAPRASFGGEYLQNLYEMAASYLACIVMRHPFVDGNKRTALGTALTFLYINGYSVPESYDEELADLVLSYVTKKITKDDVAGHFMKTAVEKSDL